MNTSSKVIILFLAVFSLLAGLKASPVDQMTAKAIATKFMETDDLHLSAVYTTDKNVPAFYIFNTTDGFVIVSADDRETPIIGYSHEGRFDQDNVPVQMEAYLQDFVARIQYGIENHIAADEVTAKQWEMVKKTGRPNDTAKSVGPLLTEKWHQGCLYNSLCPSMNGPCDHAEVGCVAVAMGMIMHYWGYPSKGWGSQSYSNAGTTLSADFGNTIYDWEHMPDSLTETSNNTEIAAIATLLFHCGVSVRMRYTNNGSAANFKAIPNAMYSYFNYSRQIHGEERGTDDNNWLSMLKSNLDSQHPIIYVGRNNSGSHAFVCDGYDDNNLLHFNWGWGGNSDGYFALGNFNPNGYNFNNSHYAIFDIDPHYDSCLVTATVYPPSSGTVEGTGEYHFGDSCTLTAKSTENYEFYCWKKNGQIISNDFSTAIIVDDDTLEIEAQFTCFPISQITASYSPDANNPNSPDILLSWSRADTEWKLLKQFDVNEELGGIATDNEYIYITYGEWNQPLFEFGKFTMDGDLIEQFNLEGINRVLCLAYDGTSFYCNSARSGLQFIHHIDLIERTALDSTNMYHWFGAMSYDPEYDGFWLAQNYNTILYNRQGERIKTSPSTSNDFISGTVYFTANDGDPHLLTSTETGVYDYDIANNFISNRPLLSVGEEINYNIGACPGIYDGKDAAFIVINNFVYIFEINRNVSQITGYRIYRTDNEGQTVMLADGVAGSSYTDYTWDTIHNGMYRFGISSVFANGVESDIVWSNPIEKMNYDVNEVIVETEKRVKKIVEDGHLFILIDNKKYSVTGQEIK